MSRMTTEQFMALVREYGDACDLVACAGAAAPELNGLRSPEELLALIEQAFAERDEGPSLNLDAPSEKDGAR